MQPRGECRSLPRHPRRHGADRGDPLRALPLAADRDCLRDGGDPGRARPRRDDGPVRGVPRLALQRGLDRLPGSGRAAGPRGDDARRVHGARRAAAAPGVQPLAPGGGGQARGSRRCAVRPCSTGPRSGPSTSSATGAGGYGRGLERDQSISTTSSFPSTGSRRGTVSTGGEDSSSTSAYCPRARARPGSPPCWSALPRRDKARSWRCSSCSAPPATD